jgi:hypothetical protein
MLESHITVKKEEFFSDRMLYIIIRGRWCDTIVLNVHAPTDEKINEGQLLQGTRIGIR